MKFKNIHCTPLLQASYKSSGKFLPGSPLTKSCVESPSFVQIVRQVPSGLSSDQEWRTLQNLDSKANWGNIYLLLLYACGDLAAASPNCSR